MLNKKMLLEAELVVATSGDPHNSYLMSSGQLWSGIRSIEISAASTTISNESIIRMVPGLSNFAQPLERQMTVMASAIFVMLYINGRTRVYWNDNEITGVESVQFSSNLNTRKVEVKLSLMQHPNQPDIIDHVSYPWVWTKSPSHSSLNKAPSAFTKMRVPALPQ